MWFAGWLGSSECMRASASGPLEAIVMLRSVVTALSSLADFHKPDDATWFRDYPTWSALGVTPPS
jgi:hypothetical protein